MLILVVGVVVVIEIIACYAMWKVDKKINNKWKNIYKGGGRDDI